MTRKVCYEKFFEKVSKTVNGDRSLNFEFYRSCTFENIGRWKRLLRRSFNVFLGNTNLVLELTTISQLTLKRSKYNIPVYSDFAGPNYSQLE